MERLLPSLALTSLLAAAGCSGEPANDDARSDPANPTEIGDLDTLVGTVWEWVVTVTPVERIEVADPTRYTLRFLPDGRVETRFDCNRGGGSYETSEYRLSFGPMMTTRMACPEDSQDALFMQQLERISTYFTRDGDLYLEMPYDSGTMHFRPGDPN